LLETHPNVTVDIGARCAERGHQPTRLATSFLSIPTAFCLVRIWSSNSSCTGYIFTFWKPTTSFFNILPIRHARAKWNIYGVFLPNEVLRRVYRNNAKRLLKNFA
jgi:hypothetical protein